MVKVTKKENDPKTHMTLIEYCYEERYLDLILRVYRWEGKQGSTSYGWEISKEYPKVTLRRQWSISGEKTFQEAYAIVWASLPNELEHRELFGEIFEWHESISDKALFGN